MFSRDRDEHLVFVGQELEMHFMCTEFLDDPLFRFGGGQIIILAVLLCDTIKVFFVFY